MTETKTAVRPPFLGIWNGLGVRLCGQRDYEPATDSWVRTRCFCLFYVPVLPLGAYRVTEEGDGWNFLQQVPVSAPAKMGSTLFVLFLVLAMGWGVWRWHSSENPPAAKAGDRGVSQTPTDPQTLQKEALSLLGGVIRDSLAEEFDTELLKGQGHPLLLLGMAYDDEATQKQFVAKLRAHPDYAKAYSKLEQLTKLPEYRSQAGMAFFLLASLAGEQKALETFSAELPPSEKAATVPEELLETYQGKRDEENRQRLYAALTRQGEMLEEVQQSPKKKTAAVILKEIARQQMLLRSYGAEVPPEEILARAQAAVQLAPCVATREVLLDALLLRLHERLGETNKEYAQLAAPLRRSVAPRHILAWALQRRPEWRAALAQDADWQQVSTLLQDHARRFPHALSPSGWALLQQMNPTEAKRWAQELRRDALGRWERRVMLQLNPWTTTSIMNNYWTLLLDGKEQEGTELLKRYAAQGIPLPQ
jgi:hypothetical protein